MNIIFRKGDSFTLTETIEGLTSITGFEAGLYFANDEGTVSGFVSGYIDTMSSGFDILYEILNDVSKSYTVGYYDYETKLWDASGSDHVYTPSVGKLIILNAIEGDPL